MGDRYVKSGMSSLRHTSVTVLTGMTRIVEFKLHQNIDNPVHIIGFLSQWKLYLDQLPAGPEGQSFAGVKMDPTVFEKVRSLRT